MQIIDGLVSRKIIDVQKQVYITCQGQTIHTILHEILVRWKRGRHRVKTNEIHDGMQVICLHERPFLTVQLDPVRLLRGMSLYQEYDETTDSTQTYLYKFPKDGISIGKLQGYLSSASLPTMIEQVGRFVTFRTDISWSEGEDRLLIDLTHAGHSGLLSFMCGLVLAYGSLDQEGDVLHTIHLSIPLVGTIVTRRFLIDHMLRALQDIGIYLTLDVQDQTYGQIMQGKITDWELLQLLCQWIGESYDVSTASKYTTYQEMKLDLIAYITKETNDTAFVEKVSYGVVKFLKK